MIRIVVPVFNDWRSFQTLLEQLEATAAETGCVFFVSAINDGSTEPWPGLEKGLEFKHLVGAEIVHLAVNLGHQRAIAVGICTAVKDNNAAAILVLDADGEDPPAEAVRLIRRADGLENYCIVAKRRKRSETRTFKLAYSLYKSAFRIVTGKVINFGNFSFMSMSAAKRLSMLSELWNNLPAAILRSRIPLFPVPIDRGRRYHGTSKMSFTSLIIHGMSTLSVYSETIFVRLFLLSLLLVAVSTLSIAFVFMLRVLTPAHATPGWATTVSFGLIIIILQVFFTALSSILMVLNARVQRQVIPLLDYGIYIVRRETLL